ncbi:MAG: hypothetical protein ONB43_22225 [candidate division KSB1 bacterium]|nr:hypothetical protein [candidate division KSB1 bacterium]MDZ7406414.1 hypothetical protein [candidate division KSB1 bacterium]
MRSPRGQKGSATPTIASERFLDLIGTIPVLQNVPQNLLQQLAPGMLNIYADGEIILQEGQPERGAQRYFGAQQRQQWE